MLSNYRDHWKNKWEYIELMNFLIERTKDADSPMSINGLAREYKEKSECFLELGCLIKRIKTLRERVAELDTIDTETKVKMIFAMSVSIDENFLNELQKDADVEVDGKNRIIKYKANNGSIELEGDKLQHMAYRGRNTEYIELMNFLIERTKDVDSPISISGLAREYKEKSGCSPEFHCLVSRIKSLRERVAELDTIDTETKVKMIFAMSVSIDENFLNELQKDADVEVDGNNRITKYRAKDGSLELEGEQLKCMVSNYRDHWKNNWEYIELMNFLIEKTEDVELPMSINGLAGEYKERSGCSQEFYCLVARVKSLREKVADMDTIDTKTKVKMIFALSVSIDENFLNELQKDADVEIDGNNRITKYRAKDGSLELTGDHCIFAKMRSGWKNKKMRSRENVILKTPGSTKRSAPEVRNFFKKVKSENVDPGIQQLREPKEEETTPIKTEPSGANDAQTPQIKFLGAVQSLLLTLEMPSLSQLQTKIEMKLREVSSNEKMPNDEILLAMEVMFTKITNYSVPILPETVESIRLKEYLCYMKAAILNSKLEGLEDLLEKIRAKIEELASNDKTIPVEKVASALQATFDVIDS